MTKRRTHRYYEFSVAVRFVVEVPTELADKLEYGLGPLEHRLSNQFNVHDVSITHDALPAEQKCHLTRAWLTSARTLPDHKLSDNNPEPVRLVWRDLWA